MDATHEALELHLADPVAVERDARARAPRWRVAPLVPAMAGFSALFALWRTPLVWQSVPAWGAVGALALGLGWVTARRLARDSATIAPPTTPEGAAAAFVEMLGARPGLCWAMLAPTARARVEPALALPRRLAAPVASYPLHSPESFASWTSTFARPGGARLRWVRHLWTEALATPAQDGSAETESVVWCGATPWWPVAAALWLGLGGSVLQAAAAWALASVAATRTAQVRWYLRWIRGSDGAWYLVDWADPEEVVPTYLRS